MNTVAEIEAAIEKLSPADQHEIYFRLSERLRLDEDGYQTHADAYGEGAFFLDRVGTYSR